MTSSQNTTYGVNSFNPSLFQQSNSSWVHETLENANRRTTFRMLISTLIACLGIFSNIYEMASLNPFLMTYVPHQSGGGGTSQNEQQSTANISSSQLDSSSDLTCLDYLMHFKRTPLSFSILIQSLTPAGASVISIFLFFYGHNFLSRRKLMYIADLIGFISTFPLLFIKLSSKRYAYIFLIFRFLFGFSVGINCTTIPIFIQESVVYNLQGTGGCLLQIFINVGIMSAYIFGGENCKFYLDHTFYFQFILAFPSFICLTRAILIRFFEKYDSPVNYIKPKNPKKYNSFELSNEDIDQSLREKLDEIVRNTAQNDDEREQYYRRIIWRCSINRQDWKTLYIQNLHNDTFRFSHIWPQLRAALILQCFQQLSGINFIVFFSSNILTLVFAKNDDEDEFQIKTMTQFGGIFLMLSAISAGFIVQCLGRVKILQLGYILCAIILFVLSIISIFLYLPNKSIESSQNPGNSSLIFIFIIFTYLYEISFNFSLGPITLLYVAEILPLNGCALSYAGNWIASTVISVLPQIIQLQNFTGSTQVSPNGSVEQSVKLAITLFCFSILCLIGWCLVRKYVLETKDILKGYLLGITEAYSKQFNKGQESLMDSYNF